MNERIARIFYELADLRRDERHQSFALSNAAKVIENLNYEISMKTLNKVSKQRGIGKGSLDRIKEILETGTLKELQQKRKSAGMKPLSSSGSSEESEDIFDFESVLGFGPTSAQKIINAGYNNLEQLRNDVKKGKIKVTDLQRFGIYNYEDLLLRIPREEVERVGLNIITKIQKLIPTIKAEIVGSYRRQRPDSGDIDILISDKRHHRYKEFILHGNIVDLISEIVDSKIKKTKQGKSVYRDIITDNKVKNEIKQLLEDSLIPLRRLSNSSVVKNVFDIINKYPQQTEDFDKSFSTLIEDINNNIPHGSIMKNFHLLLSYKAELDILPQIVDHLAELNIIEQVLSAGHVKLMAAYKEGGLIRKFDIRLVPLISYSTALLHSTGSDNFNIQLRRKALFLDYSLSEYGLHTLKDNRWIPVDSEESIFEILDTPYIPPEKRN